MAALSFPHFLHSHDCRGRSRLVGQNYPQHLGASTSDAVGPGRTVSLGEFADISGATNSDSVVVDRAWSGSGIGSDHWRDSDRLCRTWSDVVVAGRGVSFVIAEAVKLCQLGNSPIN